MRRKYTTFACVCAAAARTRRRPRKIPSLPFGAGWRASALLRRNKRTVDGVSLDDEDVHLEVRDRAPTPEEHVEGRETQRLVREGLAALPEDYRRVLVLRELHQLSYAEICEVTELELGTVKSRINRARLLLRNYLAADGNFFEKPASKVTECNQTVGGERNAI